MKEYILKFKDGTTDGFKSKSVESLQVEYGKIHGKERVYQIESVTETQKLKTDTQLELLRSIIIKELGIDPINKSRSREVVDAKKVFCGVTYETIKKITCTKISLFLNLNHATVLYHQKTYRDLINVDREFKHKFETVYNSFKETNLISETSEIESEIDLLTSRINYLKEVRDRKLLTSH